MPAMIKSTISPDDESTCSNAAPNSLSSPMLFSPSGLGYSCGQAAPMAPLAIFSTHERGMMWVASLRPTEGGLKRRPPDGRRLCSSSQKDRNLLRRSCEVFARAIRPSFRCCSHRARGPRRGEARDGGDPAEPRRETLSE